MNKFTLKNGRKVIFFEEIIQGMAGEPMVILCCSYENESAKIQIDKILEEMTEKDVKSIKKWMRDLGKENYYSAIHWTI